MKQVLWLLSVVLLCSYSTLLSAQQTYIRNYSTFTEYGTIPAATVPSSYSTNYNYNPQPAYQYKAPEKTEEDIAKEAWREDLYATKEQLSLYYSKKDYNSVITICNAYEERYPEGSLYPDIGVYMASAYLHTQQYEALANRLEAKYQYFGDRHDFDLAVADVLQQYGYYKSAYWYYKLVAKSSHKFDGYELGYSVTAARQGEEAIAAHAFSLLMAATNNNPNNYYNRALAFLNVKNPARELALQDLVTFVTKTTETLDAYLLMAKIYLAKGNSEECISAAKEYMKLHDCKECQEMIAKAEAEIADRPRKAALALAEEKEREARKEMMEMQRAEEKRTAEIKAAKEQLEKQLAIEKELAPIKLKLEQYHLNYSKNEQEFYQYLQQHNIAEKINEKDTAYGKHITYLDAIEKGDFKSVYILFKSGYEFKEKDDTYYLHRAITRGHHDIAGFFIDNGADIKQADEYNCTPLYHACNATVFDRKTISFSYLPGALNFVKRLIAAGADVNAINKSGQSPLHIAAWQGNAEIIKVLLDNGADPNIGRDFQNNTPLDNAIVRKHKEAIKVLKEHGAK